MSAPEEDTPAMRLAEFGRDFRREVEAAAHDLAAKHFAVARRLPAASEQVFAVPHGRCLVTVSWHPTNPGQQ